MNFYNITHPHYCGIDLRARSLYVCIIDQEGNTCIQKEIPANPDKLLKLIQPYIGNIIVGVECMHCWYWVSDFCEEIGVDIILGHASASLEVTLNRFMIEYQGRLPRGY